jgi:putative SOS response-associated peptidase YedK
VFSIPPERPTPNIAPSWNVAPTDPLPVVRYDAKDRQRSLEVMRWGLVPFWAKDIKVGFANINAKAEGIEKKAAFREAFRQRRCLVPVDNFYEWAKTPSGKQPYAIALKGGGLIVGELAFAGGRTRAQLRDRHHGAGPGAVCKVPPFYADKTLLRAWVLPGVNVKQGRRP